jgi:hypothetical protein
MPEPEQRKLPCGFSVGFIIQIVTLIVLLALNLLLQIPIVFNLIVFIVLIPVGFITSSSMSLLVTGGIIALLYIFNYDWSTITLLSLIPAIKDIIGY